MPGPGDGTVAKQPEQPETINFSATPDPKAALPATQQPEQHSADVERQMRIARRLMVRDARILKAPAER
jgi:hypothetical protein